MIKFSKEKVLLLHQLIAEETGGSVGVRDEGLLESALETAKSQKDTLKDNPWKLPSPASVDRNSIQPRKRREPGLDIISFPTMPLWTAISELACM